MKIWIVPQSWSSSTSSDVKAGQVSNSNQGTLEDMRALNTMSHIKVKEEDTLADEAPVTIKKEPEPEKNQEEIDKADMEAFVADIQTTTRRFFKVSVQGRK